MAYLTESGTNDVSDVKDNGFDYSKFVSNLKTLTYANGLNYNKLGSLLDCKPNVFYRYEKFERTPDTRILIKLSEYFHVSINQLLGLNEYDESVQQFADAYAVLTPGDKEVVDTILKKYGVAS